MSETQVGSLVVELAMKSAGFQRQIQDANRKIRESKAEFKNAGAGVDGFGKSLEGLKSKTDMLNKQISSQSKVVEINKKKYEDSKKTLDENIKSQEKLKIQVEASKKAYEESKRILGENAEETKKLKESHEKLNNQYDTNNEKIRNNVRSIENWNTKIDNSEARLKGMQAELQKTNKEIEIQSNKFTKAGEKLEAFGNKASSVGDKMNSAGNKLTLGVTAPLMAIGGLSAKAAIDFESAFAGVKKTIDGTPEQLKKIEQGIIDMSGQLPSTTTEISEVAEAAGQLGIQTDNVLGFSKVMIDLANSTNIAGEEGAAQLAKFANITQMSQGDFEKLGSTIVDLGNNLATTERDIVNMGMRLAGAGAQIGMTEAQIMAMAGALSSVGIEAEAGGSAFSKVMINMATSVETGLNGYKTFEETVGKVGYTMADAQGAINKGGKELDKLSKKLGIGSKELRQTHKDIMKAKGGLDDFSSVAGMTNEQFIKLFKEDSSQAIIAFIKGLGDAEKQGKSTIQILEDMEIKEVRLRDALLRASNASGVFSEAMEIGNNAWEENTALLDEASQRYETTESKMAMAKNQITESARQIGQNLLPVIRDVSVKIADMTSSFSKLNPETQRTIIKMGALAASAGPVLKIGGLLTKGVGSTAMGLGKLSKGIAETSVSTGIMANGIKGTSKVMAEMGGKTAVAGKAIGLAFSPTGLAIGGAVVGLSLLAKHIRDEKKAMEEAQKERVEYVKGYADLTKQNKNSIKTMEELSNEFRTLNPLVGNNGDLSAMTAKQKERYLEIVKKLVDSGADIEIFYNDEGELIAENTTRMDELIRAKKEEMALDARKIKSETKKAIEEEAKATKKLLEEQKKLNDEKKHREQIVKDGGVINAETGVLTRLDDKAIENNKQRLSELNKEIDKNAEGLESVKIKMIELRDAGLQGIDAELENIKPSMTNLKNSFKELSENDFDGTKTSKAIEELDRVFKELDGNINISTQDLTKYTSELGKTGLETSLVTDEITRLATENALGAEKFQLVNKALGEYNNTGKLTKETAKEFKKEFGEIPGTLEEFSTKTLKGLEKNGEGWLSAYMASSIESTKGAVEQYNQEVKKLDVELETEIISPGQYEQSLAKLKEHRDSFIAKLDENKEADLEKVRYLLKDAKIISQEEANARVEQIEEHYSKQMQSVQQGFTNVEKELQAKVNELKPELDNALVEVISGAKKFDEIWNGLSFESKTFIAEQVGIDDVSKMTEDLLKKWMQEPGTLDFIVKNLGIEETIGSLDELMNFWDKLNSEEKGKIINELLAQGILDSKGKPVEASKTTSQEVVKGLESEKENSGKAGQKVGEEYARGVEESKSKGESAGRNVGVATAKTLKEAEADAKNAGVNIVEGFSLGLKPTQSLIQSARKVAGTALSQMRSVLDTHSPSKETYKIGQDTEAGLVNALVDAIPNVEDKSRKLAQATLNSMQSEMKKAQLTVPKNILKSQTSSALSGKNKNYSKFVSKLKADELEETKKLLEADYKARERALNKQINGLDKKKNKKRIEETKKNKDALRERNEDVKQILDDRLDIVNEKMTKESNMFTDKMNAYDNSIKKLSKSSDDLTVELTNNNAIYILQAQRVKELEKQHKKMTKEFGSSSTEAIKLKKTLEEAKLEYQDYGEAIVETEKKIRQEKIDLVNDTTERIKQALSERYQKEQRLSEESLQKQLSDLEDWATSSKESINSVYDEKIKRIKESSEYSISKLKEEIEAINELQKQEDREDIDSKELEELRRLEETLAYEHDEFNKSELRKQILEKQEAREKRLRDQELNDKKDALNKEISDIQENTNKQVEIYEERRKAELENIELVSQYERENLNQRLEDNRVFYENKLNDARLQAEAEKMVFDNNQKEIVSLLRTYESDYQQAGQSLGEKFAQGFNKEVEEIRKTIDELNRQVGIARNNAIQDMNQARSVKNVSNTNTTNRSNTVNIYSNEKLDHYQAQRETVNTLRRLALGGV